jgi:hypothetical protein
MAADAVAQYFDDLARRSRDRRDEAERRVLRQEQQDRQRMIDQRMAMQDQRAEEDRQRRITAEESSAREATNQRGIRDMAAQAVTAPRFVDDTNRRQQLAATYIREGLPLPSFLQDAMAPPAEPKRQVVETTDAQGRPVRRAVTEDELITGVPTYQAPRESRTDNEPLVIVQGPNGEPVYVPRSQAVGRRPGSTSSGNDQTEGQRRTAGLLSRAQAARQTADSLEHVISIRDLLAPNFLRSSNGQQYRQAAKQWIQSVLRDESGAAIGVDEEASYFETYFRQPGDSTAVLRQKQEARDDAEAAMVQKVGGGNTGRNVRRIGRFEVIE